MKSERQYYLLLGIGIPYSQEDRELPVHLRLLNGHWQSLNVRVHPVHWRTRSHEAGRYLFHFEDSASHDKEAYRLADALRNALHFSEGVVEQVCRGLLLPLPGSAIPPPPMLVLEDVESYVSRAKVQEPHQYWGISLRAYWTASPSGFEDAWQMAVALMRSERLFRAARFLARSHQEYFVFPGQVTETYERGKLDGSSAERNRAESALLNAFKAVEAIVGDPPRNDERFFAALRRWGIDPEAETALAGHRPIHEHIRRMRTARDREAAHGASPSKGIGAYELYEYQACARHILESAVLHCLAGRVDQEYL